MSRLLSRNRLPDIGVQGNPVKIQNMPQEDFRFKAGLFDAVSGELPRGPVQRLNDRYPTVPPSRFA